ncbi:isoleucine--tRNA ligase [Sphingosinicella sp. CPCC 101087]|uniref:isoleucine--tRNA ligase n=1 Tax=Sphingosinicella sp. CPCC 101087 TaxID=2497754 RepID=UPI00101B835C|nr:isoleucine--tRNA ligase [Sphingosinicella sp. CPCC 101087]
MSEKPDYRDTVFLPKTDFPMKAGLAQKEPAILARWAETKLYAQLRNLRAGRTRFILHDGPPYANGDIHMGHAMNKILKDLVVRSQSLLGKDAPYIPGWDCHGLPIEWKVEEQYRKKKLDKDDVPRAQFRAECRAYAEKWVEVQSEQFQRLGVQGEWDDPYLTMKYEAEAKIVEELMKFAESGQLYRGAKPVMWSPVEKTALAEAEVEYEEIVSTQIDVGFEIVEAPQFPELVGALALIWTTTPWTIPVNQAIAYGPDIEYALFEIKSGELSAHPQLAGLSGKRLVVAKELVPSFLKRLAPTVEDNSDLVHSYFGAGHFDGAVARHPMHHLGGFFAKPRPFLPGDHVTTDAGTGLVHMAPDHGEEDFLVCKAAGIDPVFAVTDDGRYREDWLWLGGQGSVINNKFNAPDGPINSDLREAGALLSASADFRHSYPHSWRSKAKIIYRCTPQWFISMDKPLAQGNDAAVSPATESPLAGFPRRVSNSPEPLPDSPDPNPSPQGEGLTLRGTALAAIDETRWVPGKSKNRIRAMVEGRPDWVISRQRAWGVPIALYVDRRTGDYLRDPAVNSRIIRAFHEGGADAWFQADHQALLGNGYRLEDYEPVNDILDVWFDSGSTHSYVIEARYGENVRADVYCEGTDQHRGWFQSSLLESCGTRGRAPYASVLTHGFALDAQGRKMSKSVGNVVDPLAVMRDNGADILRLWVASTDYFEDVKIGKEVLATTTDAYRKLRNTFRYLLGALEGFGADEAVAIEAMPELERWVLHRLASLGAELGEAIEAFEFNRYVRLLMGFANDELSAFFFDIRKDALYCDVGPMLPLGSAKRRAYRTVLDHVFHALVRWLSPVLCFTTEEVWTTRYPQGESVHLLEWPEVDPAWRDEELGRKWDLIRASRERVTEAIEPLRREKVIGSSLEARILYPDLALDITDEALADLAEIYIVSEVMPGQSDRIEVTRTDRLKCGRCWRHLPEVTEDGALCGRCDGVVNG